MDWVTISALATAGGTLVLAAATFASVRSANRAARVAERALMAGLRPLLVNSREEDPQLKVGFADQHWVRVGGGRGTAEVTDEVLYLTMSVRNVGTGVAVLHGWLPHPNRRAGDQVERPRLEQFHRLTRDIYVPAGDIGFWQGALRDPSTDEFATVTQAVRDRQPVMVDLLYGDQEGGQRVISRFGLLPRQAEDGDWFATVARHWNVDRPDPR
ncbi:MAG: hypothetical protein ACJ74O_08165 [Frankiaceae bacterium]